MGVTLQNINLGSAPGAGDGDPARTFCDKINDNNDALEAAVLDQSEVDARVELYQPATGTFSPTIQDASLSNGEGQTYIEQSGYYRRTGDVCQFWVDLRVNSLGSLTGTDQAYIADLPFTAANIDAPSAVNFGRGDSLNLPTAGQSLAGYILPNTKTIRLEKWSATSGSTTCTVAEISDGAIIFVSGSYIIAP